MSDSTTRVTAARLTACRNPACLRWVQVGTHYCCFGCNVADQPPKFDPDGYHSDGCNQRAAERGERSLTP